MKRINVILIVLLLGFSGCTEFLTVPPQDELIWEEYWKTENDVVNVLGQAYARVVKIFDEVYIWSEFRGGLLSPEQLYVQPLTLEFYNFNVNSYNELTQWGDFYHIINLTNTIIEYAPLAKNIDPTFSDEAYNGYLAEAYYLRCMCYFYLVKSFKDVPFIDKPYSTDDQEFNIKKSSEQEIIDRLISDLAAIVDIAFKADHYRLDDPRRKGRVNKDAINALLAEIYLWNDDYHNCITTCNKIIPYPLMDGEVYFNIFGQDGNSLESIFELQFNYVKFQTTNEYEGSKNFYSLTSNNFRGESESNVSELLMGLYDLSDLRQHNKAGDVTYNSSSLSIWKYEGLTLFNPDDVVRFDRGRNRSDANWILYRYPDIILMKAEAYAELDDFSSSLAQLNIVRNRAGLGNSTTTEKKRLLIEILNERAREFVGEGKRYFDLVRVCRRDIDDRLSILSEAVMPNVDGKNRAATKIKFKDLNSWFLPIFYNELILNKELEQNPFY